MMTDEKYEETHMYTSNYKSYYAALKKVLVAMHKCECPIQIVRLD